MFLIIDNHRQPHSQPQTGISEPFPLDRLPRYQLSNKVLAQTVPDQSGRAERKIIPIPYQVSTISSTAKDPEF